MEPLLQWKSNKYYIFWVCVCSLSYPVGKRLRRIVLSSAAYPAVSYFSTLSHKRHDFRGKKFTERKTRALIFSTIFVWNICNFKKKLGIIVNVCTCSVKYPLFLSDLNQTWIFSTCFRKKKTRTSNLIKVPPVEPSRVPYGRADRQTGRS